MRRLTAEERALWARLAGTVDKRGRPEPAGPQRPPELTRPKTVAFSPSVHRPTPAARKPSAPLKSNTLDSTWDRALATGRIRPDQTLDLHGHTLSSAHTRLNRGLADATRDQARVILLITGRAPRPGASRLDTPLRGIIRASIGDWLAASPFREQIAAIRGAHPRHGGAGALYIILRRPRD